MSEELDYKAGFADGAKFAARPRPVDDGEPLFWKDDYNLIIVRNPKGRKYSHLQFSEPEGCWTWAANMDDLPTSAVPLYDPEKNPGIPSVSVWQEGDQWYADCQDGYWGKGTAHLTASLLEPLGGIENLDKILARKEWEVGALRAIKKHRDQVVSQRVQQVVEWIKTLDLDLDDYGAAEIAELLLDRYNMTPREDNE